MYEQAFNTSQGAPGAAAAYLDSLIRLHNYEEAIALVNKIGSVRPNNIDDYLKRGTAYAALNKPDDAAADFGRAMDLAEKDLNLVTVITHQMVMSLPPEKISGMLQARVAANQREQYRPSGAAGQALLSNNQPQRGGLSCWRA